MLRGPARTEPNVLGRTRWSAACVLLVLGSLLSPLGCGEPAEEGTCLYQVELDEACYAKIPFRGIDVQVSDSAHLYRGFYLNRDMATWSDYVVQGDVEVTLDYCFLSPGWEIEGQYFLEVPSSFTDTCQGSKTILRVDCAALPTAGEGD